MNTNLLPPKHKTGFDPGILVSRPFSWVRRILERWHRFIHWRSLQRLELLNDHALRDIGVWREPESRLDEWWKMNPPP
jgi:hypothetical protein